MKYTPDRISSSRITIPTATSSRITKEICWSARSMDTRYRTEPMSPPFSSRITRVMAMAFSPVFRVPIHWPSPLGFCRAVS